MDINFPKVNSVPLFAIHEYLFRIIRKAGKNNSGAAYCRRCNNNPYFKTFLNERSFLLDTIYEIHYFYSLKFYNYGLERRKRK
jgi:hypothetical protein